MSYHIINSFRGEHNFLSNFANIPRGFIWVRVGTGSVSVISSEHAFMACKTLDERERTEICSARNGAEAKRLGRMVELRPDWEDIKDDVMLAALRQKFKYLPFRKSLIATKDDLLIEGNFWHDNTWGNCGCLKCKDIKGLNTLGELLMQVRGELK